MSTCTFFLLRGDTVELEIRLPGGRHLSRTLHFSSSAEAEAVFRVLQQDPKEDSNLADELSDRLSDLEDELDDMCEKYEIKSIDSAAAYKLLDEMDTLCAEVSE